MRGTLNIFPLKPDRERAATIAPVTAGVLTSTPLSAHRAAPHADAQGLSHMDPEGSGHCIRGLRYKGWL